MRSEHENKNKSIGKKPIIYYVIDSAKVKIVFTFFYARGTNITIISLLCRYLPIIETQIWQFYTFRRAGCAGVWFGRGENVYILCTAKKPVGLIIIITRFRGLTAE